MIAISQELHKVFVWWVCIHLIRAAYLENSMEIFHHLGITFGLAAHTLQLRACNSYVLQNFRLSKGHLVKIKLIRRCCWAPLLWSSPTQLSNDVLGALTTAYGKREFMRRRGSLNLLVRAIFQYLWIFLRWYFHNSYNVCWSSPTCYGRIVGRTCQWF